MWTHIDELTPIARKNHRCCLCGYTIPKGTKYAKRTGIDDEGWLTMHMHEQCEAATLAWHWDDWEAMPDEWSFCHETLLPETLAEIKAISQSAEERKDEQ